MRQESKDFKASPSLGRLEKYIDALVFHLQKAYNEAPDDHRYHQGKLRTAKEVQQIIAEATR